jgi:hypothetical protein
MQMHHRFFEIGKVGGFDFDAVNRAARAGVSSAAIASVPPLIATTLGMTVSLWKVLTFVTARPSSDQPTRSIATIHNETFAENDYLGDGAANGACSGEFGGSCPPFPPGDGHD